MWYIFDKGYVLYSQEGHMSAALMKSDRPQFGSGDQTRGTIDEKIAAFDSYVSYAGRYETKGDRLFHHIEISLFPNWIGTTLERTFTLKGNTLTISVPPTLYGGGQQTAVLIFERVKS